MKVASFFKPLISSGYSKYEIKKYFLLFHKHEIYLKGLDLSLSILNKTLINSGYFFQYRSKKIDMRYKIKVD